MRCDKYRTSRRKSSRLAKQQTGKVLYPDSDSENAGSHGCCATRGEESTIHVEEWVQYSSVHGLSRPASVPTEHDAVYLARVRAV
ncbi:hypothetical protein C8Q78DRAFT_1007462 [Trametes maxima]|nr:hypothetical protein C8Q78DRAFT_1007462 [Trametes maxima]